MDCEPHESGLDEVAAAKTSVSRRAVVSAGIAGAASFVAAGCSTRWERARPSGTSRPPVTSRAIAGSAAETVWAYRGAGWVIEENRRPGALGWRIPSGALAMYDKIRGFASTTSVDWGSSADLYVSTAAASWRVEAYRVGWYGGSGARLVWTSADQPGHVQPPATIDATTKMRFAPWHRSLTVDTGAGWPPGQYMLKLVSSDGGQSYVPLMVRDDGSSAPMLAQSAVMTWQAYNQWGGASLYMSPDGRTSGRSDVVSFDRPYYHVGAGEHFGREYEFHLFAERNGYDITFCTDVDTHADPSRLLRHKAVLSLGHDEYYSTAMRAGFETARDHGVNLVFFGANCCFRKVRLEPSNMGDYRHLVNYRVAREDPMSKIDPKEVTVNWREAPSNDPESSLIGNFYESNPVDASMVVVNSGNWLFEGSGLADGDALPHLVGTEYDRVFPWVATPENIEVLCHSPLVCRKVHSFSDVTWYSAPSGAGVFASGTLWWIPKLASDQTD